MKYIESDKNSLLKLVTGLQTKSKERRKLKLYVTEGLKTVSELRPDRIHTLIVSDVRLFEEYKNRLLKGQVSQKRQVSQNKGQTSQDHNQVSPGNGQTINFDKLDVVVLKESLFRKISLDKTPQGIMALVHMQQPEPLETSIKKDGLYLGLDCLQDPGNMGTILRTCDAVGIDGVFISADSVDPYHPKVVKACMGSMERVKLYVVPDLSETLTQLSRFGITNYGTYLANSQYHFQESYVAGTCFVIGNEGSGISDKVIKACQKTIKIPMPGGSESLNAGIAAAVVLYEGVRQRLELTP
jgi:TrmH family RNA methyltransferase